MSVCLCESVCVCVCVCACVHVRVVAFTNMVLPVAAVYSVIAKQIASVITFDVLICFTNFLTCVFFQIMVWFCASLECFFSFFF